MQLNNCYYKSLQQFVDYYSSNTARELAQHYHHKTEDFMPAFSLAENYVEKLSDVMRAVDEGVRYTLQGFSTSDLIESCYRIMRERVVVEIPDIKELTVDVINKIQAIEKDVIVNCISRNMEITVCGRRDGNCIQVNEILSHSCSLVMSEEESAAPNKLLYVALGIGMLAGLYFCARYVKNLFISLTAQKPAETKPKRQIRPVNTNVTQAKKKKERKIKMIKIENVITPPPASPTKVAKQSSSTVKVESSSSETNNTSQPSITSIEGQWEAVRLRVQEDINGKNTWKQIWR